MFGCKLSKFATAVDVGADIAVEIKLASCTVQFDPERPASLNGLPSVFWVRKTGSAKVSTEEPSKNSIRGELRENFSVPSAEKRRLVITSI